MFLVPQTGNPHQQQRDSSLQRLPGESISYKVEKQDRRRRLRPVTGETARKELTIMKHILRLAVKLQQLTRNPFDDLEPQEWPAHGQERTRHLVGDEWQRLLAATPLAMRPAVVLLVNSGMRRGEMMNLEWSDVNLETGTAWIAKTKGSIRTGKGRWVRLPVEMIELIKMLPPLASSRKLFWQFKATQLSTEIGRAIRRAQLHNLRLHDLRHTFATTIRQSGHGLDTIAKLLGHADLRQTKRYAHLAEEQMTQALQSLSGRFTSTPKASDDHESDND
jgi:integrase